MSSNDPIPNNQIQDAVNSATGAVPVTRVGAQLREAREAAGLTRAELAQRLCMSGDKLEALEQDDFARFAGATYVRGYIRNVCKELKLDAGPVLEIFSRQVPEEPKVVPGQAKLGPVMAKPRGAREGGAAFRPVFLLLAVAAAAGYWWIDQQGIARLHSSVAQVAQEESGAVAAELEVSGQLAAGAAESEGGPELSERALPPAEMATVVETPAEWESGQPETDAEVAQIAEAQVEAPDESVTEETGPTSTGSDTVAVVETVESVGSEVPEVQESLVAPVEDSALALSFSAESWVEVTDAAGNKLLSKLQPAGSTVQLTGEAPFSVMLGNAAATTVSYAGKEVDSAPLGNRRTRKLTVGG
ncbi:DUF4115 domain-containing protein [Microbulbifer bruguierae]|uniref:DUF4115 domain-containing protein n=1 Tax=Microbulbifer bruguierae TaxID=3029061 RepID=A0ABY8NJY3_9GAMM|nr:RodZ domain-containing protein [Microbulbifer bruguierae]WGL17913.1 DUF4115 domain-containing protein [Microbulbifer bruguierae]